VSTLRLNHRGVDTPRSPELRNLARPPAEAEADLTSPTENE